MFYVLVKFKGNPMPDVWGVHHVSFAAKLATMDGVEWCSPVIHYGTAIEYKSDLGGQHEHSALGEHVIRGYEPKETGDNG